MTVNSCALWSPRLLSRPSPLRDSPGTSAASPLLCPPPVLGLALVLPSSPPTGQPAVTGSTPCLPRGPASSPPHAPCPHSPGGIGGLGLCLDGGPRAPQEGLGSGAHAIVVVAVERGAVARGREGAVAPRGGSTPRRAQVEDPAGSRAGRLPVGVGGGTGWSREVGEAAAEKGGSSAPAGTPGALSRAGLSPPRQGRGGRQGGGGRTHRSEASSLLMYSSRMLVSRLEGSRAPLRSWPAGGADVSREGGPSPPTHPRRGLLPNRGPPCGAESRVAHHRTPLPGGTDHPAPGPPAGRTEGRGRERRSAHTAASCPRPLSSVLGEQAPLSLVQAPTPWGL